MWVPGKTRVSGIADQVPDVHVLPVRANVRQVCTLAIRAVVRSVVREVQVVHSVIPVEIWIKLKNVKAGTICSRNGNGVMNLARNGRNHGTVTGSLVVVPGMAIVEQGVSTRIVSIYVEGGSTGALP